MARPTSSRLRLPPLRASTTARCSSDNPERWRMSHPLASSGKLTLHFRWHRSNSSPALDIQTFRLSPSWARSPNTDVSVSDISSDLSFCGTWRLEGRGPPSHPQQLGSQRVPDVQHNQGLYLPAVYIRKLHGLSRELWYLRSTVCWGSMFSISCTPVHLRCHL